MSEALAHQAAGRHGEAIAAYRRHLETHPEDAEAWAHLGEALGNEGRLDEAIAACRQALARVPDQVGALANLGLCLARQGHPAEAESPLRQVLTRDPGDGFARLALVECLLLTGRADEALRQLEIAPLLPPGQEGILARMTELSRAGLGLAGVRRTLDRWIQAAPDRADLVFERASLNLLEGRFLEGWRDYEARFRMTDQVVSLMGPFEEPRWDGSPFPGRTLLLHWEQGYGDTLMFIRFAKAAKARGGRVVAVVQPPLADLVATCEGVDEVVPHGAPLPVFDLQLPLLSLPWVLQVEEATIPSEVPYLRVPDHVPNRDRLDTVLSLATDRLRIGYAWAGLSRHLNDRLRSMPGETMAALGGLPDVAWHCFQWPAPEARPLPSVPLSSLVSNFSDTAYALSRMDLVITVDTALAHLAGALGLPTFLMVPCGSEWRWQLDREDSPWYPTLRIYRQRAPGDWDSVVAQIRADLLGEPPAA